MGDWLNEENGWDVGAENGEGPPIGLGLEKGFVDVGWAERGDAEGAKDEKDEPVAVEPIVDWRKGLVDWEASVDAVAKGCWGWN